MIKILEISWLGIAIITSAIAVWQFFTEGATSAIFMLGITGIAFIMYSIRRKQRIRMDEQQKQQDTSKYH